jgi:cysteine desulfurase
MMYLDHAAGTPVDSEVLAAMLPYFSEEFYNPSATYARAQQAKKRLEQARAEVAGVLGSRTNEVTFTAGGTEANNLAIRGVRQAFPGKKLITTSVEHDSVLEPALALGAQFAPVKPDGIVDIDALLALIDDDTVLLSVMLANNEVGSLQPVRQIAQRLQTIRDSRRTRGITLPLYFHTDACQAGNYLDLHVSRLGVDMMTLNGGKIYGPKQSGVLYVRAGTQLTPQILGGGQERGRRSGTENVAFAVGFAAALVKAQSIRHEQLRVHEQLRDYMMSQIEKQIPSATINGSRRSRLANNVHVTIPGSDNERVLFYLDEHGVMAAAGSACSASNDEPSHVLRAMGASDEDAQASLRFTLGRENTRADVDQAVHLLVKAIV